MVIIENPSIDQKDIKQYMRETNKTIMSTYRRTKEHEPITQPVSRGRNFFNARRGSQTVIDSKKFNDYEESDFLRLDSLRPTSKNEVK